MRIVAGSLKGRAIVAPESQGTRPTSDRARQAVFNVLEHAPWAEGLNDARVIDLYAGSGALGFEALSRGGAFCLFVETDEGARGATSCGAKVVKRTIGPATSCGKNATNRQKSRSEWIGSTRRR